MPFWISASRYTGVMKTLFLGTEIFQNHPIACQNTSIDIRRYSYPDLVSSRLGIMKADMRSIERVREDNNIL